MQTSARRSLTNDLPFWKLLVWINGGVPLVMLLIDAIRGELGSNPVNAAIHTTGILSLSFLVLSLAITPLRWLTGWNTVVGFRRSLGLFGFFYACVHVVIYFGFDRAMSVSSTIEEVLKRRYLQVGLAAVILMMPLAVTSTNAMISRLGARRWKLLHRLSYLVAALGVIHYFMLVKSDIRQPVAFGGVVAVLLAARFVWHYVELQRAARRTPAAAVASPRRKFWTGELKVACTFDETPDVRTFRLVPPEGGPLPFDFLPGQYLNLQLLIDGNKVHRSYTIASSPSRNAYCELSIKREETGLASAHLHRQLRVGDRLRVSAPAGKFVFTGAEASSVLLIGGGVGITPLMAITRDLTDRGWPGDIHFVLVTKTSRDIIFRDELHLLQRRAPNLHLHITLTRQESHEPWDGNHGRIHRDWLVQSIPGIGDMPAYICGPNEMMDATCSLLAEIGVPTSRIFTEAFVSPGIASGSSASALEKNSAGVADQSSPRPDAQRFNPERPVAHSPETYPTVTFARSGKAAALDPGTTLLEASEELGIDLPFECRSGICGQCKVQLIRGNVIMDVDAALSPSDRSAGVVLACQSRCEEDVTVDA